MDVNSNVSIGGAVQKPTGLDAQTQQVQRTDEAGRDEKSPKRAAETSPVADSQAVEEAVEKLGEFLESVSNRGLQISIDKDLSQVVLKVVNRDNEETIRQIPTEEVLQLMKRMKDLSEEFFGDTTGLLVENKA